MYLLRQNNPYRRHFFSESSFLIHTDSLDGTHP
nr:MAG TPA: hypothetical protein [Caudoviricetes sp.]